MNPFVQTVDTVLGNLTLFGDMLIIVGVIFFLVFWITNKPLLSLPLLQKYAVPFSIIVSLIAMLGSLFYSNIAGYTPCDLCWFQRIFMYPQPFLFGLAIIKKDRSIIPYSLLLSSIGAIIAAYHYLMQIGFAPALKCAAVGYSTSCSQRFVMEYGYITIPMMALTAFLLIIVFLTSTYLQLSKKK